MASESAQKSTRSDSGLTSYKCMIVIQKRYNARMVANGITAERWLTKRQIAEHFGFTTRWVELRMREGLPSIRIGNRRRYRLSQVEAWLVSSA